MKQFEVRLEDKPGELAKLTSALGRISIRSLTVDKPVGGKSLVRFLTIDNATTRTILKNKGIEYSETDVMLIGLLDRPGELARLTNKLGQSNINICSLQLIDRCLFALEVCDDDLESAKKVIGDNLIEV